MDFAAPLFFEQINSGKSHHYVSDRSELDDEMTGHVDSLTGKGRRIRTVVPFQFDHRPWIRLIQPGVYTRPHKVFSDQKNRRHGRVPAPASDGDVDWERMESNHASGSTTLLPGGTYEVQDRSPSDFLLAIDPLNVFGGFLPQPVFSLSQKVVALPKNACLHGTNFRASGL